MGVSIYYTAKRERQLSNEEGAAIAAVIEKYAVEDQIEQYDGSSEWLNWESFCVYDPDDPEFPPEPGVIFEGATRLPDNREDALLIGASRWLRALTEIHSIVADAEWNVHIDDYLIKWDEAQGRFDPEA